MKSFRALILVFLVVLAVGAAQLSVAYAETGAVQITVYEPKPDNTKEPVIGATVVISDASKQFPDQAQITNENGQVVFPLVQPGSSYIVTVSLTGYMKVAKKDIKVVSGVTSQVSVGLLPDMQVEVVVKGREKMVELDTESQGSTSISGEEFQDLPVFGRDYQAVLTLAPGVQDTNNDGNPNVHGSRETDFRMAVDGVSNVDPLTGTRMSDINPDSIEEIEIIDSGADASFGGAVGGYGRIVTKSGSNKFEGSFNMFIQDSLFDGDGAGQGDPVDFQRRQPSLYLSGPIVRDKLWFSVNHELIKIQEPFTIVNGPSFVQNFDASRNSDKLTWQVTPKNKLQFEWRSDPVKIEPDGVSSLVPAESGYTLESGGPATTLKWTAPFSPTFFWEATVAFSDTGLDATPYRPGAKNTCVNGDPSVNTNFLFFSDFYCADETFGGIASGAFSEIYHDQRKRWTYAVDAEQFIDRWLGGQHRIKAGMSLERADYERDITISPFLRLRPNVSQSVLQLGGASQLPDAYLMETTTYYFPGQGASLDPLTRFDPQHGIDSSSGNYYGFYLTDTFEPRSNLSITAGLRVSREELTSDGYRYFYPDQELASYHQYLDPAVQANLDLGINPETAINNAVYALLPLFTIHPLDDPANYAYSDDPTPPPGTPINCEAAPNYSVCKQLTYSRDASPLSPDGSLNVRTIQTFSIASNGVAPRLSVAWDPRNDAKTKISASWGRYFGDTFLAPLVAENGPDQVFSIYGLDTRRVPKTQVNSPLPASAQDVSSGFSVSVVDRNLKQQHADEWSLGVEREIASETAVKLRYVNRRYVDQFQDKDINHVPLTDNDLVAKPSYVPDCVVLENGYYDCTGYFGRDADNPSAGNQFVRDGVADLKVVNPFFNNVYLISNYNRSTYYAYIVELTRRYFQNWEMNASYTYSKSWGQAENWGSALGDDPTNSDKEEGPLSIDQPHVFKLNGRLFVPRFGGFRLGGAVSFQSGLPYSIIFPRSVTDYPTDLSNGWRAREGLEAPPPSQTLTYVSNRTVYPTGHRNDQRNPSFWTVNVNFQKEFQIKDVKASLQVEAFNLLNDDTEEIAYIQRNLLGLRADNVNRTLVPVTVDTKVATRRFGRRYQAALRLNF